MKERIGSFKSLRKLHTSLVAGQFLFAIISLFVAGTEPFSIEGETFNRSVQVVATIFSIAAIFIGLNVFKRTVIRIRAGNNSGVKRMEQYRQACTIWWAFIEGPAFFSILCYLWTNNLSFFFLSCLHTLILFLFRPRKENIVLLLNLNNEDISHLER